MQPTHARTLRRISGKISPWVTTSETAKRPPGLSTRNASRRTLSLVGRKIDHAVRDDHVRRIVGQRNTARAQKGNREHWTAMNFNLRPRIAAEFLGTGFLLMAIVGSGSWPSASKATGASLVALILAFGTISGALFNLAVTLAEAMLGGIAWREALAYVVAQVAGGLCGVGVAHLMFGLPFFFASHHVRSGGVLGGERIRCHVRAAGRDLG